MRWLNFGRSRSKVKVSGEVYALYWALLVCQCSLATDSCNVFLRVLLRLETALWRGIRQCWWWTANKNNVELISTDQQRSVWRCPTAELHARHCPPSQRTPSLPANHTAIHTPPVVSHLCRPHRPHPVYEMRPIATDVARSMDCVSVCWVHNNNNNNTTFV